MLYVCEGYGDSGYSVVGVSDMNNVKGDGGDEEVIIKMVVVVIITIMMVVKIIMGWCWGDNKDMIVMLVIWCYINKKL